MPSSADRRAAQRRNARAIRENRSLIGDIGKHYRTAKMKGPTFRTLGGAVQYAKSLPGGRASHIIAYGEHRYSSNRYSQGTKGWASVSEWAMPGYYGIAWNNIEDETERLFEYADQFRVILYENR
jgi:hypothetical protein